MTQQRRGGFGGRLLADPVLDRRECLFSPGPGEVRPVSPAPSSPLGHRLIQLLPLLAGGIHQHLNRTDRPNGHLLLCLRPVLIYEHWEVGGALMKKVHQTGPINPWLASGSPTALNNGLVGYF